MSYPARVNGTKTDRYLSHHFHLRSERQADGGNTPQYILILQGRIGRPSCRCHTFNSLLSNPPSDDVNAEPQRLALVCGESLFYPTFI